MELYKRVFRSTLLVLIAMVMAGGTVLAAYSYYANIQVSETNGNSYDYLPVIVDVDNDYLSDNGYISLTGLDTRILSGSAELEHLVADDKVLFVAPSVGADSRDNYRYTLGNTDLDDFPIITGYDGYITVSDSATLEFGSDFESEFKGWVDTSAGSDKNLIYKEDAFQTYISGASDVTSRVLKTDSMTFYPDADAETTSVDGYAGEEAEDATWTVLRGMPGDTSDDSGALIYAVYFRASGTNNQFQSLRRGIYLFDTSALPDSAVVTSATLSLFGNSKLDDNGATPNINIYSSDPATNTAIVPADYATLGSVAFCDTPITYAGFSTTAYNDFALNAAGMAAISVDGISKFSSRNASYDVAGADPAWVNSGQSYLIVKSAETAGTANDPKLVVNYTYTTAAVTATGVTAGEHTVKTYTDPLIWSPSDDLHFTGAANSEVNCGGIYHGQANLWYSCWFKLDNDLASSPTATQYLWGMDGLNPTDYVQFFLHKATGDLAFQVANSGTGTNVTVTSSGVTFVADTWYHAIASVSAANGTRLIVNGGTAVTDAYDDPVPSAGNFTIGTRAVGNPQGFEGEIANVACGIDSLTPAEEAALYANTFPADATDIWYIDEGTGTNITSYGTQANAGTAGAQCSWQDEIRPCKFSINVDGTEEGGYAQPISVTDNANDWTINQNNVLPYIEYYKHTVADTLVAWYQPISMIIGTNLDDREGTDIGETGTAEEDAVITWGANPAGVSATISSLVSSSQPVPSAIEEEEAPDIVPEDSIPTSGTVDTATLEDNPLYPIVELTSDNTGFTEEQIWFSLATLVILVAMGLAIVKVSNHLLLAGVIGLVLGGFFTAMGIYQWWMMLIFGFVFIMSILMERKPVL